MAQIKSEKSRASTIATGITSAANQITSAGSVTRDATSYYTANTVGRRLIINEESISKNVRGKITAFVKLIHSTADEFESADIYATSVLQSNVLPSSSTSSQQGASSSAFPYSNPQFVPQKGLFKE